MLKNSPSTRLTFSLIIFFLLSSTIISQFKKENYQILGISVEGNKSADANTIIASTGLRVGDEIEQPGDQTNNAIKRLWALNIFSDVQIIIERKIDNGVFLLIKVTEYPRIEEAKYVGNDELDEDDFNEKIYFGRGQTLKPYDVFRAKIKIKNLYDEEGYLNAEINPKYYVFSEADTSDDEITVLWVDKDDDTKDYEMVYDYDPQSSYDLMDKIKSRILLVFEIDEGEEVKVRGINFYGNNAFDDDDLESEFDETSVAKWWKFWDSGDLNKEDYEKDKVLLGDFYRKNGT